MGVQSSFPNAIWDGSSGNRDPANPSTKSPDYRDWIRMTGELQATQRQVGISSDPAQGPGSIPAVDTISVEEYGDGAMRKTVLTLTAFEILSTNGLNPPTDGAWGSSPLYTFPSGFLSHLSSRQYYGAGDITATDLNGFGDTGNFEIGVGSTAAIQLVQFGLTVPESNIIPKVTVNLVDDASDDVVTSASVSGVSDDGTVTPITAYLNGRALENADHGPLQDTVFFTGTITLLWTNLGGI